eukprot:m.18390 g.18390  ORF g.18390 m.18390 type:complete len:909 (+) comp7351_c0_seq2:2-2728(+)
MGAVPPLDCKLGPDCIGLFPSMAISRVARMPLVLCLLLVAHTAGQSISTVNGTLVMRVGDATMTLAGGSSGAPPTSPSNQPYSPTLTQADLQATITSQIQPQITSVSSRTDAQLNTTNAALALANTLQQSLNTVQSTVSSSLTNMQNALLLDLNSTNARVNGQVNVTAQALSSVNNLQQFLLAVQVNFSSSISQLQSQITSQLGTANSAFNLANTVQQSCNTAQLNFNASITQVQNALQSQINDLSARVTTQGNTSSLLASFASIFDTLQRSFNTSLSQLQTSLNQQLSSTNAQVTLVQNVSTAALTAATSALSFTSTLQTNVNSLQSQTSSNFTALQVQYNSLLQNYTVLQQYVLSLMQSFSDLQNQLVTLYPTAIPTFIPGAYVNMYLAIPTGLATLSDASAFGFNMGFNRVFANRFIQPSSSTGTWTHTMTGTYVLSLAYRQNAGADVWTVFAVTKDGPSQAVGVSARTGSENSRVTNARIVYTVDSTVATYQVQQWTAGTKNACGGTSCFVSAPTWTNFAAISGGYATDGGRLVDYTIFRLGDSETAISPTPVSNSPPTAAFASFYNMGSATFLISATSGDGLLMPFNRLGPSLRITPNPGTSTWTHALTGTYIVYVSYRQDVTVDQSTVFAVTKSGTNNAVGVSARTGSGALGTINANHRVIYQVDSTTATYQLQHWASVGKTVGVGFAGGPPLWGFYSTLCGGFTGDTGRALDYLVYRLGDLDQSGGAGTTNNTAFANMFLSPTSSPVTVSDVGGGLGVQVPFNRAGPSQRIQLNTATGTWTHSLNGTYFISVNFRQAAGGDVWVALAVTKGGNTVAVGTSARVATDNGGTLENRVVYTVDSTTATYQLQQWSGGPRTVCAGVPSGCWAASPAPSWTNYATLSGGPTETGRAIDMFIQRLGD